MKRISNTFANELIAAGLSGLHMAWGADGVIEFGELVSEAQRTAVLGIYDSHDPLNGERSVKWSDIKAERERRSEAGCQVAGHWFHNDIKSRSQWERMANRSSAQADSDPYLVDSEQVMWKTMSGSFVPLTAGFIRQVVDTFEIQEVSTFKAAETHRAAMVAAADPSAYDYSGDWPEIFEE